MSDETPWHLKNYKQSLTSKYRLIPAVERVLIEEQASSTRDTKHLHPSEICKRDWCPRSSWYTINDYPKSEESFTFQRLNVFAEGHSIHKKWQDWLITAGVLEQAEVPIKDEEHRIIGHADGIINDSKGRAILEIKSVGAGTVRMEDYDLFQNSTSPDDMWKKIRKPFQSHLRQVNLYMHCTGIHDAVLLYEWKATQEVKEFSVKFQPELVESILAGCRVVIKGLDQGIPPMRPMWVDNSSHKTCKFCPYKKVCWKDDDDDQTITGPEATDHGGLPQ